MIFCTILILLITAVISYYLQKKWERRGLYMYRGRDRTGRITYEAIKNRGLKHGAYYSFFRSHYMPIDLDIIKAILIKNHDHFINRGLYFNPKVDPLTAALPQLENQGWKDVRETVSPVFAPARLKMVFPALLHHAENMSTVIETYADSMEAVEVKDLARKFGIDAMGSCTFGFEINTLKGENVHFQELVQRVNAVDWKRAVENLVNPKILKLVRFRRTDLELENAFRNLIQDVTEHRSKSNKQFNDVFEYMRQITDTHLTSDCLTKNRKLSPEQMFIQLYTFFNGSFDTSSSVVAFTLLELCQHQEIQDKLRRSIMECLKSHEKLTYESIMEMEYLDQVLDETFRKHPPVTYTVRSCNKAFKIPGSNIVLQPGETVAIPIYGVHMDPDYYPDPEKFDPERFSVKNKSARPSMSFFPFGDGPRNCVGFRLGSLVTKVAVAKIISQFRVTLNAKTITPIRYASRSLLLEVDGGIWVNFSKL